MSHIFRVCRINASPKTGIFRGLVLTCKRGPSADRSVASLVSDVHLICRSYDDDRELHGTAIGELGKDPRRGIVVRGRN